MRLWHRYGVAACTILTLLCTIIATAVGLKTCGYTRRSVDTYESKYALTWHATPDDDFGFYLKPSNSEAEVTSLQVFLPRALVNEPARDYYLIGRNNHISLKKLKSGLDAYIWTNTKVIKTPDAVTVNHVILSAVVIGVFTRYVVQGRVVDDFSLYKVAVFNRLDPPFEPPDSASDEGTKDDRTIFPPSVAGAFPTCRFMKRAPTDNPQHLVDGYWPPE